MTDRTTVMSWLEGLAQDDWRMYHSDSEVQEIARNAIELLKEPVKQIEDFRNFVFNQNFSGKISERDLALINFWISRFEDDT